jgi:hypothetical protein
MAPPLVTGAPVLGSMLAATPGTWAGGASSYAYQWLRCTQAGCTAIAGATAPQYRIAAADLGRWVEVQVTASNGAGEVVSRSTGTVVSAALVRRRVKKRA